MCNTVAVILCRSLCTVDGRKYANRLVRYESIWKIEFFSFVSSYVIACNATQLLFADGRKSLSDGLDNQPVDGH